MGQLRDILTVGKPAPTNNGALPPAVVVGRPARGLLYVLNNEGFYFHDERKGPARRLKLVLWQDCRRIDIDGHGFEQVKGRSVFAFTGGGGVGRVAGTTKAPESHLVVTTDTEQKAWTLPIDPIQLRNLLGKVLVQVEDRSSAEADQPEPVVKEEPAAPVAITHTAPTSVFEQVMQLADLKEKGLLTDAEFTAAKAKVLGTG